eukprot:jgi/Astpho2/8937/fgenesh1_pm.00133_%23_7_t
MRDGSRTEHGSSSITARSEDFNRWYLDVIREAQLADNGPVRGTFVVRPYAYAMWEGLQQYLNARFKERGVQNAYFPQLIPLSFLEKEADHVEGFAPELAIVTKGGGHELEEPLAVRPTSETIINHMISQWINSYRDLPMKLNQWVNVHRWELRTRPFLRTTEFLWQEAHTAHATAEEAAAETQALIEVYRDFAVHEAAIPVIAGRKSRMESFAGADETLTIEGMMGDRKALQAGTTHNLGTNFAKAFGTRFLDASGQQQLVHQCSAGMSTRMLGAIIMTHGDDAGLQLPPNIAPIQVVIIPIVKQEADKESVEGAAQGLASALQKAGIRSHVDATPGKSPGWKFNEYELKGVPVRIEIGPRDVQQQACVVGRRDRPGKQGKQSGVSIEPESFVRHIQGQLQEVQDALLQKATEFRDANIVDVTSYEELQAAVKEGKWARGPWAGTDEDESSIKQDTSATLRCIPFDQPSDLPRPCLMTQREAQTVAIFAKAH